MTAAAIEVDPVSGVHAALDAVSFEGLSSAVVRARLTELARAEARIQGLKVAAARVLERSGAARAAGATSTGALLAGDFGGDRAAGDRLVRAAEALEAATETEEALAAGQVTFEQARVIAGGMAKLPDIATPEQRGLAEKTLLRDAERLSLRDLRRRTDRVTDAYLPRDEVDAHENSLLENREKRALAKSSFRIWDNRDGTHSGDFTLPNAQAAMLKHHVDHFAAPRRDHLRDADVEDNRTGRGFVELCERLPETDPTSGPSMTVNLDYETLAEGVRAASLSDGTRLSAGQARRMAARLSIIPQVLGGESAPLDLGKPVRLFTIHQRRAIEHRDKGCTFPGCERPPSWCEINHVRPWWSGGQTEIDNGALVCAHHHRQLNTGWKTRMRAGLPEYQAPGSDTWQRNTRWRP